MQKKGKIPGVIVSVAHLDDDERALVLGVLLEEVLSWVRSLPGSSRLKALIVFDEVYGFLPPHPANPPTKRPLVALMKQARAFGVGVLVATQNQMDLDYRALGNAGLWCIGRLRVVKNLAPRWFLMRDVHDRVSTLLLQPRWAMSLLRGPMTRTEIRQALEMRRSASPSKSKVPATTRSTGHEGTMRGRRNRGFLRLIGLSGRCMTVSPDESYNQRPAHSRAF